MNIIILGAGEVGSAAARHLATEKNNVTIVDVRVEGLQALQSDLDVRTIVGRASSPMVLEEAGIRDAELLLAVTSSDETNMTACQVAHTLYHTGTLIARVRSADYLAYPQLFRREAIQVEPEDEIVFVTHRRDVRAVAKEFLDLVQRDRRVMIAGGGNVGKALAQALEGELHVKVIEFDRARANMLAESLNRAVVLHGDATDRAMLVDEDIDDTDVSCAVMNDDENNIMASMLAKHLGRAA